MSKYPENGAAVIFAHYLRNYIFCGGRLSLARDITTVVITEIELTFELEVMQSGQMRELKVLPAKSLLPLCSFLVAASAFHELIPTSLAGETSTPKSVIATLPGRSE